MNFSSDLNNEHEGQNEIFFDPQLTMHKTLIHKFILTPEEKIYSKDRRVVKLGDT